MIKGRCCCGEVRFSISERPKFAAACHCSRCRKVGATPFAIVEARTFELHEGLEAIVEYHPEESFKYIRCFCGKCGTSLGELSSDDDKFPIPLNCFDEDLDLEIRFHEHVATKPSWETIPEGAKQFEGDPP
jgi:hypothetical protein